MKYLPKLPNAPTAAAARAGLPRPRKNRAQDPESQPAPHMIRDGQPAPSQIDGTHPARQESAQDKPRPRADKLPTIRTASYPQEHRAEVIHGHGPKISTPRRRCHLDKAPGTTTPSPTQAPADPPDRPDPVSIFSIFPTVSTRRRLDFSPLFLDFALIFAVFSIFASKITDFSRSTPISPKNFHPDFSNLPSSPILPIFLDFSRPVRLAIFSILCYNIFQQILVVSAQIPQTPDMVTMHKFISVVLAVF